MANAFYNVTGNPGTNSPGLSATMRAEFAAIAAGFDKLPSTFVANRPVVVNAGGTALTLAGGGLILAGDLTTSGAFNTTLVQQASVSLTLPAVNGTLATLAGTETLSNKTLPDPVVTGSTNVTGTGKVVLDTGPTLSNPVVGTQATSDSSTKAASTAFMSAFFAAQDVAVQVFTNTGTYTPNAKMVRAVLICQGGGGGGAGAGNSGANLVIAASGGGAGSLSMTFVTAADIGASQPVTIGAAGTAGPAGSNPGGNGGDTSIGALCIGKGGSGSAGGASGGLGGVAGTGDITNTGEPGESTSNSQTAGTRAVSGAGGSCIFGGGGLGVAGQNNGAAGTGNGSGGSGGESFNQGGTAAGGAGTAGIAYVIEILKP